VIAHAGTAALTATTGTLDNSSLIQASTSATLTAGNLTNSGSVIAQTGNTTLTATAGTLDNSGLVLASNSATLTADTDLTNSGSVIAQTGNATLTAMTGTLLDSGLISALTAGSIVALNALHGPITESGAGSIVAGGSVDMSAFGDITLDGLVKGVLGVSLNSGGAITQTGSLMTDLLIGSAAGTVDLAGATTTTNSVATLGSFTATGTFVLDDGVSLLIDGVVTAASIMINDNADTISLGNGGFVTGGAVRPSGTLQVNKLPTFATTPGAYLFGGSVLQTGNSFSVTNIINPVTPESILSITLPKTGGGTLQFSGDGLDAPNTWLIVSVGNGSAGGPFIIKALDFAYSPPPGRANFTGLINGLTGAAAAGVANIQPQPNANFRVDGCPIHSVNCALLPTQGVPTTNPVNDINIGAPLNTQNPEDLVLPVVSDERYELVPCNDPSLPQGQECPAVPPPPRH
jgi:adhesin HecA-like repeat protein